MIKAIVAHDDKLGIADEKGIPWHVPSDRRYIREKTEGGSLLMGYETYLEFTQPLSSRQNYVLTDGLEPLRDGFEPVKDLDHFMKNPPADLWVFGGAGLFDRTLKYVDELYVTTIEGDHGCTKFFPEYRQDFEMVRQSPVQLENGIQFRFQIWRRKTLKKDY